MVAKSTTERHARGFGYRQRNESIRDAFQCVYGTREGAFYNQQDRGCSSMSEPAAIIASLVDVRNIAEHSSVVLKIHVPQERALEVIAAFGWPTGANPVPVAIARLDTDVAPPKLVEALGDVAPKNKFTPATHDPSFSNHPLYRDDHECGVESEE